MAPLREILFSEFLYQTHKWNPTTILMEKFKFQISTCKQQIITNELKINYQNHKSTIVKHGLQAICLNLIAFHWIKIDFILMLVIKTGNLRMCVIFM